MRNKKNKGIALVLTMIILSVVLGMALITSLVFSKQIKTSSSISDSIIAYYAAETGIEFALWYYKENEELPENQEDTIGNAKYIIEVDKDNNIIKSIGSYKNTKRAIKVNF